jgi:hypothetical protein
VSSARRHFWAFLGWVPIAFISAQACGGNALENHAGFAGGSGLSGSSAAGASSTGGGAFAGAPHSEAGTSSGQAGAATAGALGRGGAGSSGAANGGSGGLDVSACTNNTQCEIVPLSCCSCGNSGKVADFTAINAAYEMQFDERCAAVDCATCVPIPPPGLNDPYFYLVPTCQRPADAPASAPGRCVVVDLRATEITACMSASDCQLRSGTACCSGCGGRPVALNGAQAPALSELVCDSQPAACPACAPSFDGYQAICSAGRCGVVLTP